MIRLPAPTQDPNLLALSRQFRESRTGSVAATWALANRPQVDTVNFEASPVCIFKNGALLQPTVDYSIDGQTVTFVVPPIVGDRVTAIYWFVAV